MAALGVSMNSWDRMTIIEKIKSSADQYGASNYQQQKQLIFSCTNAPEREVFFGLFSFFYDEELQENKYERQQLSGVIMFAVTPSSPLSLDGSVYAAAKHWDYSVEELPWYWCKTFGKEAVTEFLSELIPDCSDSNLKRSIETMLFWSKGYKNDT
jgi:hypothetical protein